MPPPRRHGLVFLSVLACGVLVWRVPALAREGGHRRELGHLLGKSLPASLVSAPRGSDLEGTTLAYLYSETCPYCAIDRELVVGVLAKLQPSSVKFVAVHMGRTNSGKGYWEALPSRLPDALIEVDPLLAAEAGVEGVPVLVVVQSGLVVAAWQGKMRWSLNRLALAVQCRIGQAGACVRLTILDAGTGFAQRVRGLVGRVRTGGEITGVADGVPLEAP